LCIFSVFGITKKNLATLHLAMDPGEREEEDGLVADKGRFDEGGKAQAARKWGSRRPGFVLEPILRIRYLK
jgi:hypothetical protein